MRGFLALRLRHKLALSLSVAAVLPVLLASVFAFRVVLQGQELALNGRVTRQLRIAMNLVLRQVERTGEQANQLAESSRLVQAVGQGRAEVEHAVADASTYMASAWVQVFDARGRVLLSRAMRGSPTRFLGLSVTRTSPSVVRAMDLERQVTLDAVDRRLVIRAAAPIVDADFVLRGVVVLSLPMDGDFADAIKGDLGAELVFHAGREIGSSSFLDPATGSYQHIPFPEEAVRRGAEERGADLAIVDIADQSYTVAYATLRSLEDRTVGLLGVALSRRPLLEAMQTARQSLSLGAAGAFLFALGLAAFLSRRLVQPLVRVHAGALRVAKGDLDVQLPDVPEGDEIGDLAVAFRSMTFSLRENQQRLAARMSEIVALHDAGRAISSVLDLPQVLRKIVDSMLRVLDAKLAALWLVRHDADGTVELTIGVARSRDARGRLASQTDYTSTIDEDPQVDAGVADPLVDLASDVARSAATVRLARVEEPRWRAALAEAGVTGSLLAGAVKRKGNVVAVLLLARDSHAPSFTSQDESLMETFADQAASAIENSRLYGEVRAFSEELEAKVALRTQELVAMNDELGRALGELRETQGQLLLSERMAGLGTLVDGVAHEINSPSAAIRGSVDALSENVQSLARRAQDVGDLPWPRDRRQAFIDTVSEMALLLIDKRLAPPVEVRRVASELHARFLAEGIPGAIDEAARTLAELGAEDVFDRLLPFFREQSVSVLVGYLDDYAHLRINTGAIRAAITQTQRIVGALKSYSHLDQAKIEPTDLHEGLENTLMILHHELKYGIKVVRHYRRLPSVFAYVDELNQVWTNLIQNAVQSLGGKGEIVVETVCASDPGDHVVPSGMVAVRITDNGPGIAADVLPRIFEPFFTTKRKGEGTGLGLGIVAQIVEKHQGRIEVESRPGRTSFTVWLSVSGPGTEPNVSESAS